MERKIRLSIEELEKILQTAKVIKSDETLHDGHMEPGELVLTVLPPDSENAETED